MKRFILLSAHIVITVLLLSACSGRSKTSSVYMPGDTLQLKYAENLLIIEKSNYTVVNLRNPWDTLKTLHTYILINKKEPEPIISSCCLFRLAICYWLRR